MPRPLALALLAACALASAAEPSAPAPGTVSPDGAARTVVHDGTAVACPQTVAGARVAADGATCPIGPTAGVGVAEPVAGEVKLPVGTVTLRAGDPDAEYPCGENRFVVSFDAKLTPTGRTVTPLPVTSSTYVKLASEALGVPGVTLVQLFRVDLEGDGKDEVVLAAHNGDAEDADRSYAFIAVRRIGADGQVRMHELYRYNEPVLSDVRIPVHARVVGLTDANGDGTFELVIRKGYYDGFTHSLWSVGDAGATALGGMGCGA